MCIIAPPLLLNIPSASTIAVVPIVEPPSSKANSAAVTAADASVAVSAIAGRKKLPAVSVGKENVQSAVGSTTLSVVS